MASDTPFEIVAMQPWMIPGMAQLQALEYKVDPASAEARIRNWFDSDFSRRRGSIVLVGVSEGRVIALQTYTPWPYVRDGRVYRTLQSGATLVHPDFRGRKIFQRMLVEGNRIATERGDDFFVGFPVPMSYGGFIKDKWIDLGRLRWWIRPLRPFALARRSGPRTAPPRALRVGEALSPARLASFGARGAGFQLTREIDFFEWRYWGRATDVRYFERSVGSGRVGMAVKRTAEHGFDEVVVGKIRSESASAAVVAGVLLALAWAAFREGAAALSTALLDPLPSTWTALALAGFIPAKPTAALIVRPLRDLPEVTDRALWRDTCIEDMDTW